MQYVIGSYADAARMFGDMTNRPGLMGRLKAWYQAQRDFNAGLTDELSVMAHRSSALEAIKRLRTGTNFDIGPAMARPVNEEILG
jgi:hypothetical protein